ncbi:LTA synthase family protein [Crenothrix polyspora]|uniref:Phosphoglycerol transferase family protein, alkaline phosphatase superfamily n=1 Tax=Crenothrix polyspora TaxID=360316 RepID=A0A1R4HC97_9GAMM|nr:LTA synthase family protein [Crenothrix polyspora]SJM93806.1 Phosphoglycerol transferase family protein, alkaline phosphatase superfamily [Crenothrix polyspora]
MLKKSLPLISTALLYSIFYFVSSIKFDVQIQAKAIPFDFLVQLGFSYILYALSRRLWIFLIIQTLIMGILYIGNAVKISFFGGPIMPDDVYALRSLLLILEGWRFFAAAIPLAAIACLLVFNFSMRHWSAYLASTIAVLLGITVVYKPVSILTPLDKYTGSSVWDQRSNYLWHGATVYTLQEGSRYFALADAPPDQDSVQQSAENLLNNIAKTTEPPKAFTPRNIHLVLLESFWDPSELKKAKYTPNPLSPEFRKLWKSAEYSHAMPPVFGGYTANSEFEVLCGFPVVKDNVKFERQLLNSVPCLPHILADKGYRTVASHPNVPVFWNRVNVYRNIGFQTYWSIKDFVQDDMNREFMADSTLYRQVTEKISDSLEKKQPILDYIVTYFGHWNYPLGANRPSKVKSASKVEEVTTYANTVYYKSRELMGFIDDMRKRDPDSIIAVFGDHLPFLGENFAGYVDSGVLAAQRGEFTPAMFRLYVSTPIIIIDGKRGPLKLGSMPLYQVPKLLLNLLNFNEPSIMDYTSAPPDVRVRPLPGLHFNVLQNNKIEVCKEPPYLNTCQNSARWLSDVNVVSNDLFIGRQFSRPKQVTEISKALTEPAPVALPLAAPTVQP